MLIGFVLSLWSLMAFIIPKNCNTRELQSNRFQEIYLKVQKGPVFIIVRKLNEEQYNLDQWNELLTLPKWA